MRLPQRLAMPLLNSYVFASFEFVKSVKPHTHPHPHLPQFLLQASQLLFLVILQLRPLCVLRLHLAARLAQLRLGAVALALQQGHLWPRGVMAEDLWKNKGNNKGNKKDQHLGIDCGN